ncbi:hypothetical protein V8B97DRAFT_1876847, partial [Scleroderma yunnanense]
QPNPSSVSPSQLHQFNTPKCPISLVTDNTEAAYKHSKSFHSWDRNFSEGEPLPACAVCLSQKVHNTPVIEYDASKTWDNKHNTFTKHVNKTLISKSMDQCLCSHWQQKDGCLNKHSHTHLCLGCGSFTHRAQSCHRAQKIPGTNTI